MPYIPDAEPEVKPSKSAPKKKSVNFDDDEFEGVSTGSLEFEKETTFTQSQDCTHAAPLRLLVQQYH